MRFASPRERSISKPLLRSATAAIAAATPLTLESARPKPPAVRPICDAAACAPIRVPDSDAVEKGVTADAPAGEIEAESAAGVQRPERPNRDPRRLRCGKSSRNIRALERPMIFGATECREGLGPPDPNPTSEADLRSRPPNPNPTSESESDLRIRPPNPTSESDLR
ncbi:MAG: hypothetical protein HY791_11050, partial [Deltaproteobacteria bacterium]|nr:hypothetical protein [Deltaproteobacteria bacterium]